MEERKLEMLITIQVAQLTRLEEIVEGGKYVGVWRAEKAKA